MKATMRLPSHRRQWMAWSALTALVLTLALSAAPLAALTSMEPFAYYSVVRDKPFAPFTDLQSTSLVPYYSVVH